MPFNVVFDLAYDQQRVLLEDWKPQRIGNADLFGDRLLAGDHGAMEPVAPRFCPLPTLFAFLSRQACVADFRPLAPGDSRRNPTVLFPFPKQAVAIVFVLRDVFRSSPATSKQK